MLTFLWFHDGVTPHDRKRVQPDLQQALVRTPAMCDNAGLTKGQFDMRWVSTGIRVSVNSALPGCLPVLSQVASITTGTN